MRALAAIVALSAMGCGAADPIAEAPELELEGQTKCGVTASQSEPLIIEWPAAQRTKLEALAARGAIAVRYSGCEMEVVAGCKVPRVYAYTPTTRQKEQVKIKDEDELFARLPLGAVRLVGSLEKAGELNVSMVMVGTYETDRLRVRRDELQGSACAQATHVVDALIVGAFEFYAGAEAAVEAGVEVGDVGGGARSAQKENMLRSAGDQRSCESSTQQDIGPPDGCGALLRVEVSEILRAAPPPEPVAVAPPLPTATAAPLPSPAPAPSAAHSDAPVFTPYGPSQTYEPTSKAGLYWGIAGGVGGALILAAIIGAIVGTQLSGEDVPEDVQDLGSAEVGFALPTVVW
jgi:hypothetical protein